MITSKSISIPHRQARRSFILRLTDAVIDVMKWINRNHNDYDIRELMGELTPAERAAQKAEVEANYEKNTREALAWSDIYHPNE